MTKTFPNLVAMIVFVTAAGTLVAEDHKDPLPKGAVARFGSARLRHGDRVNALVFSPDGKRLFSASDDFSVRVWDVATGRQIQSIATNASKIVDIAVSQDGEQAVFATHNTGPVLWTTKTGERIRSFAGQANTVALSLDGKTLFAGGKQGIRCLDVSTGEPSRKLESGNGVMTGLEISPDGKWLAGVSGAEISAWELGSGKLTTQASPDTPFTAVAFGLNGRAIVGRTSNGGILVWDLDSKEQLKSLQLADSKEASGFALARNGSSLFVGHQRVLMHDWRTGEARMTGESHLGAIRCLAISDDGKIIASGGQTKSPTKDFSIRLWDVASGNELPQSQRLDNGTLTAMALSNDETRLAASSADKSVTIWNTKTHKQIVRIKQPNVFNKIATAFSRDGSFLACGGRANVTLWDTDSGEPRGELKGQRERISDLKFSRDGRWLIAGDGAGNLFLWDAKTHKLIRRIEAHREQIWAIDVSWDGSLVVTGSFDKTVALWNVDTGKLLLRRADHRGLVRAVRFSPDGLRVASSGDEQQIVLWETATGNVIRQFKPDQSATSLDFCNGGRVLVSGHYHDRLHFWDIASGKRFHTLRTGSATFGVIASRDDRSVFSAGTDSSALRWELDPVLKALPAIESSDIADEPFEELWRTLLSPDSAQANLAAWRLVGAGKATVSFLRDRISLTAAKVDAANIRRLIGELDDDQFPVREAAMASLRDAPPAAIPLLEQELQFASSEETIYRIKMLLRRLRGELSLLGLSPESIRSIRAVQVLAQINTPESIEFLRKIADRPGDKPDSRQARQALLRSL